MPGTMFRFLNLGSPFHSCWLLRKVHAAFKRCSTSESDIILTPCPPTPFLNRYLFTGVDRPMGCGRGRDDGGSQPGDNHRGYAGPPKTAPADVGGGVPRMRPVKLGVNVAQLGLNVVKLGSTSVSSSD